MIELKFKLVRVTDNEIMLYQRVKFEPIIEDHCDRLNIRADIVNIEEPYSVAEAFKRTEETRIRISKSVQKGELIQFVKDKYVEFVYEVMHVSANSSLYIPMWEI